MVRCFLWIFLVEISYPKQNRTGTASQPLPACFGSSRHDIVLVIPGAHALEHLIETDLGSFVTTTTNFGPIHRPQSLRTFVPRILQGIPLLARLDRTHDRILLKKARGVSGEIVRPFCYLVTKGAEMFFLSGNPHPGCSDWICRSIEIDHLHLKSVLQKFRKMSPAGVSQDKIWMTQPIFCLFQTSRLLGQKESQQERHRSWRCTDICLSHLGCLFHQFRTTFVKNPFFPYPIKLKHVEIHQGASRQKPPGMGASFRDPVGPVPILLIQKKLTVIETIFQKMDL